MEITLEELIQEMNDLEREMQKFEWKYSIKSAKFYRLVQRGKIEETSELHEWLGLYKIWLRRREKYLEKLKSPSPLLKLNQPLEKDFFKVKEVFKCSQAFLPTEEYIYSLPDKYPSIKISELVVKRMSAYSPQIIGTLYFENDITLRVLETVDFLESEI